MEEHVMMMMMIIIMMKTIIIIINIIISNKYYYYSSENTSATYQERTKSRNYKKNSHIWHCTHTLESTDVKLQHSNAQEQGLFQVHKCKYSA
jgi:hypothetical protein